MQELIKYAGILVVLVGAAVLAIPQFMGTTTNVTLASGLILAVSGVIVHIVINRNIN